MKLVRILVLFATESIMNRVSDLHTWILSFISCVGHLAISWSWTTRLRKHITSTSKGSEADYVCYIPMRNQTDQVPLVILDQSLAAINNPAIANPLGIIARAMAEQVQPSYSMQVRKVIEVRIFLFPYCNGQPDYGIQSLMLPLYTSNHKQILEIKICIITRFIQPEISATVTLSNRLTVAYISGWIKQVII